MARMDKAFVDVLDGMHMPKLSMANHSNAFVLTVAFDAEQLGDGKGLEVGIDGSTLTISSERHEYSHEVTKFSESTYSERIRLSAIPIGVDTERARSEFDPETSTLTVTLPKLGTEQTKRMRLQVKAREEV